MQPPERADEAAVLAHRHMRAGVAHRAAFDRQHGDQHAALTSGNLLGQEPEDPALVHAGGGISAGLAR